MIFRAFSFTEHNGFSPYESKRNRTLSALPKVVAHSVQTPTEEKPHE